MDLSAIGQQFGLTPQQTEAAIQSLGPAILAGINRSPAAAASPASWQASKGGLAVFRKPRRLRPAMTFWARFLAPRT